MMLVAARRIPFLAFKLRAAPQRPFGSGAANGGGY